MEKMIKKDLSGKTLFLLGIVLIGISIFNLFEDPIVNGYYRLKRNFERQNSISELILTPTSQVLTTETSKVDPKNPLLLNYSITI